MNINVCTRRTENPNYDVGEDSRKSDDGDEYRALVDSDAVNAVNMDRSQVEARTYVRRAYKLRAIEVVRHRKA